MRFSKKAKYLTKYGAFNYVCAEEASGIQHSILWIGNIADSDSIILRVQSSCLTSTALGGIICDCAEQIDISFKKVAEKGRGIILYLAQEGRGYGLFEKVNTMCEMNQGADTVSAFTKRGMDADVRDYSMIKPILEHISVSAPLQYITNNPDKVWALEGMGFKVEARVPIIVDARPKIEGYLRTKRDKLGHDIPD